MNNIDKNLVNICSNFNLNIQENVQDQLNDAIQDLQVKIAQVSLNSGVTSRQRQAIGSRIFDATGVFGGVYECHGDRKAVCGHHWLAA